MEDREISVSKKQLGWSVGSWQTVKDVLRKCQAEGASDEVTGQKLLAVVRDFVAAEMSDELGHVA